MCDKGGALMLIRYGISRKQACKNSLSKWRSVHQVYEGHVAGITAQVECLEGNWPKDKGIAMLSFDSMRDAMMWKDCIPEIKQQDWMDGPDWICVPMRELPPADKRFVQILDMDFAPCGLDSYMNQYVPATKDILTKAGASESVVATGSAKNIKGLWNPQHLIINFWKSREDFEAAYNSADYRPLKEQRQALAQTNAVVFELENLFKNQ